MGRTAVTETLPFWRSEAQAPILYAATYWPDATAAKVAATFGLSRQQVGTEVHRLERAGLVRVTRVGRSAVLSVDIDHPATPSLRNLVDLTIGPLVELASLYELDGVERVAVFGSWARRHLGEPGPRPIDVDVLVVGRVDAFEVYERCLDVAGRVGLPVNPMVVTSAEVADASTNPILTDILEGPLAEVLR